MALMIILFVLMLLVLWLASRYGGLALGAISGLGLAVMVFCFGLEIFARNLLCDDANEHTNEQ